MYSATIGARRYTFGDLATLLAKASPLRSGDQLAGLAAETGEERVAAQMALADVPLATFLQEPSFPTRPTRSRASSSTATTAAAFAPVAHLTVGEFRDWLLSDEADDAGPRRARARPHAGDGGRGQQDHAPPGPDRGGGEMPGRHALSQHDRPARPALGAAAAQPSDRRRRAASPPASSTACCSARRRGDRHQSGDRQPRRARTDCCRCSTTIRERYDIPTQSCVLAHVTTTLERSRAARRSTSCSSRSPAPRPPTRASASISRCSTRRARRRCRSSAARSATTSCISRPARAARCRPMRITASISRRSRRAPMRWRGAFKPLLVNTVVGFIGPEYLYDGKQIIRAGLEDHFCGKLLGLPMGVRRLLHQPRRGRPGRHGRAADAAAAIRPAPRSSVRCPTRDTVGDLDEVVDLRAGADARLADGGPIDRTCSRQSPRRPR